MRVVCILWCLVVVSVLFPSTSWAQMRWVNISNPRALCNDFTQAGFFHENYPRSKKWIIVLESGGLCFSPETCNKRLFHPSIQSKYLKEEGKISVTANSDPDKEFDAVEAWRSSQGKDLASVISPLMSSIYRYHNDQTLFPSGLVINGRDVLDRDYKINPLFCHHNHVVLPYCSSDLWLGNDTRNLGPENEENFYAQRYKPDSPELQFVFRGAEIFQSAIIDLLHFGLNKATELVLVGSSAGGIGVINHIRWLQDLFKNSTLQINISIIIDSAWFINFNGDIAKEFSGFFHAGSQDSVTNFNVSGDVNSTTVNTRSVEAASETFDEFFDIISGQNACNDLRDGVPCCILAHCLLTDEKYYPSEVPLFSITSLYDMFLLTASLRGLVAVARQEQSLQPGYALEFLRIIAEYGGQMNSSVIATGKELRLASFYVTGCFQHIYLATSTLWGEPGKTLFGNGLVEVGNDISVVRHSIQSDTWTRFHLKSTRQDLSIRDALQMWHQDKYIENTSFVFRDNCQGPHCNDACPEMFLLGQLDHSIWSPSVHALLAFLVCGAALLCIVLKVVFALWLCGMEWKQKQYLHQLSSESIAYLETALQFPSSTDDDAISVSCVDLGYSITCMTDTPQRVKEAIESSLLVMDEHTARGAFDSISISFGSEDGSTAPSGIYEPSIEAMETKSAPHHISRTPAHKYERLKRAQILPASYKHHYENEGVGYKLRRFANQILNFPLSLSNLNQGTSPFSGSHSASDRAISSIHKSQQTPVESVQATPLISYHSSCSKCLEGLGADCQPTNETCDEEENAESTETVKVSQSILKSISVKQPKREKVILQGISLYFNPGELIGIMGPSGCGKTTFLDILTGRRHKGTIQGHIFVNGISMEEVRDWYVANTGYVLQLATPYFEELTVRENLTLAAQIKLSKNYTQYEKFERVEQVMIVTGLLELANTVVGGATGPGLSGGQKRRLVIALQLLKLPNVIFLDEPTSGLDAASSFELLSHLNRLADSNRTVILTIHQPRLEIFHMFHRLVLLSDGKVAYHGVPEKAYEVFVTALKAHYLERGLVIPELEDQNPADVLMDILGNSTMRQIITEYYQSSDEPKFVRNAIIAAAIFDEPATKTMKQQFHYALYGAKRVHDKHAGLFHRLAAQEARASKRSSYGRMAYLPLVFFIYGLLLGTVYFQQTVPHLVMSGFCVYSVASALFMFPILYNNLFTALEVYHYEHGDGIGNAADLVIQGFIRTVSLAFFPVVVCAGILYLLLVNSSSYDILTFLQVLVVNISLNQAWISLLIAVICAFPNKAIRLSPVISSVAGFTSGFFIQINDMHWGYRWLFYINPNYYGFSASSFLLLQNFDTGCKSSSFDCYTSSGVYILQRFGFDAVNPYLHILILQLSVLLFLLLAVLSNWLHHANLHIEIRRVRNVIRKSSMAILIDEDAEDSQEEYEGSNSATFSSRNASGTIEDEIRSFDLNLWNSPACLQRNLLSPTFQIENQSLQNPQQSLTQEDKEVETGSEESHGISLVELNEENASNDQDDHEGERFLSPIMEELSDEPSDFDNSIERPGSDEISQTQTTCSPQTIPPTTNTFLPDSEKPHDLMFMEETKPTKESKRSTFSNKDEDQLPLHSHPVNDKGSLEYLTMFNECQAHSSTQEKRKVTKDASCDPERTPEPKRKMFSAEVTSEDQDENSRSPHIQAKRKVSEYLREGEQHCVWKPGITRRSSFHHLPTEKLETPSKEANATKKHLLDRKRSLDMEIIAAQEALRSKYSGSLSENSSPRITFRRVKQNNPQTQFQDVEEQVKQQRALYSSCQKGSKASIKRLSPHSSPKTRHRNPSSTSRESTSDEITKFKSLNNSPERWWKLHRRSTSSPSMPFISSGINQASRPHHVSPLTTPTISSSDVKRRASAAPYEAFLRRQASARFTQIPPFISPQRHRRHPLELLPSLTRTINSTQNFTDTASISLPHRCPSVRENNVKTAMSKIPLAPQKSFSPSKLANRIQLQHPLEKFNTASPLHLTHDTSGGICSTSARGTSTAPTSDTYPPGPICPLQQRKNFPKYSTTRKRSLSDSDV